mgnify:CR=1 FL=1
MNIKPGDKVKCIKEFSEIKNNPNCAELGKIFTVKAIRYVFGKQCLILENYHPFRYAKTYPGMSGYVISTAKSASVERFLLLNKFKQESLDF